MAEWNDPTKWFMDIIKYTITFALGSFITITFLEDREDERAKNNRIWAAEFALQRDELFSFDKSAHLYSAASSDAFVELYDHDPSKPGETITMRRYENTTYDDFVYNMGRVRKRCANDQTCLTLIKEIETANSSRHKMYDDIVDNRLDHDPWSSRDKFESLKINFDKKCSLLADYLEQKLTNKSTRTQ